MNRPSRPRRKSTNRSDNRYDQTAPRATALGFHPWSFFNRHWWSIFSRQQQDAIVHIFQNNGTPPPECKVVLEATNSEEITAWGGDEIALPQAKFWTLFSKNNKRLQSKSRLIQIDSNRVVESVAFQQLTFQSIGDPEQEEVGYNYGYNNVKNRFADICATLHRLKSKEVTSVYKEYQDKLNVASKDVMLTRLKDPTEPYINLFSKLLYPKTMLPIDINSSTIQYRDDDENVRNFSDLSSGEREVVILTFDIIAQNPSDCVILIDEPEVHLHPELTFRLIKVLRSIGERNQYFLFTHSPDVIGNSLDTGVHFVRPKIRVPSGNQVIRVDASNVSDLKNIPNIRETIGMVSVGKKLLFVEGNNSSIDRNVFATIAKAAKLDVAIIPSDSCTNINNMALMVDTLEKGLFGVELFMVRDRDGLVEEQVNTFRQKSKDRLFFLPFYHIENAFLHPAAIEDVCKKLMLSKAPPRSEIEKIMINLAKQQINHTITLYVKSEFYFQAGNFDVSPKTSIDPSTTIDVLAKAMSDKKNELLVSYNQRFGDAEIAARLRYWKDVLEKSVANGWSEEARKFFIGKRLLKEIQLALFGSKSIALWEHIVNSDTPNCMESCKELKAIIDAI